MWMMPLPLHVNQKSDYDYDDDDTFGNDVLRLRSRVAVKLNFLPHIRQYTYQNENFEYSYPLIQINHLFCSVLNVRF